MDRFPRPAPYFRHRKGAVAGGGAGAEGLAAKEAGRPEPRILASRWSIFAQDAEEAWQALAAWRGLRAPGRLEAVDPATLRERADELPRHEILQRYSLVASAGDYVTTYTPLVTEVGAEVVTIQTTSLDQETTIAMLGSEVLPQLRDVAAAHGN